MILKNTEFCNFIKNHGKMRESRKSQMFQHYIPLYVTGSGWPRHRENREFGSYFFQTGKTQGILL